MKTCSYCGAEYPDDAVVCATDHTSLATPPVLPLEELIKARSRIRSGARLFGFFLAGIAFFSTWLMLGARIDTPEEFVSALWSESLNAIPMPFAVFVLVLTLRRPRVWMRAALAVLAGLVLWLFVWRWLVHCDYNQWQWRGVHVIHVDHNHMVYEMDGFTNEWQRATTARDKGLPMLFISAFMFAAVSALLIQLLSVVGSRRQTNDTSVHVKPIS